MTTRILGHSREPVAVILERQRAKHAALEARLGRLMSQRADLEDVIADLIDIERRIEQSTGGAS
jgi:uncharacterized protein YigA (DUF484 family)